MMNTGNCKTGLRVIRSWAIRCPEQEGSESFVGQIQGVGKAGEAVCGLSYYFSADQQIWLMTLYDKNEASDLTPKEKKALKSAIEAELRARQAAQVARERKSRRTR